jgi:hypothetical protein
MKNYFVLSVVFKNTIVDSNLTPNKIEMAFVKLERDFNVIMQKPFVVKHNANKIAPNTELEHQVAVSSLCFHLCLSILVSISQSISSRSVS